MQPCPLSSDILLGAHCPLQRSCPGGGHVLLSSVCGSVQTFCSRTQTSRWRFVSFSSEGAGFCSPVRQPARGAACTPCPDLVRVQRGRPRVQCSWVAAGWPWLHAPVVLRLVHTLQQAQPLASACPLVQHCCCSAAPLFTSVCEPPGCAPGLLCVLGGWRL